jgi:sarcosine oxidase
VPRHYDVAVVGVGAHGSHALLALARRGLKVIGLDRFSPPHNLGSSHGHSRIIRQAYYESPAYVPLVRDAWERWLALERDGARPLLQQTGGLMLGPADGELIGGAAASAHAHGLPHERLDRRALSARYPEFRVAEGTEGLFEPMAGILDPEACISTALDLAARAGAEIRTGVPVTRILGDGTNLRIQTAGDERIEAGRVILAAGAGMPALLGGAIPLEVERQVMFWFSPRLAGDWRADTRPVFIWEWERDRFFYGIPDHGRGVKVARHHEGEAGLPGDAGHPVRGGDEAAVVELVRRFLPTLMERPSAGAVCHYTNTADRHFVIGPHPANEQIILASACSGHGFKFAGALGEVLADLVTGGTSRFDLRPFAPDRFTG